MTAAAALQLTLMRHAQAEPQAPRCTDEERALDGRGRAEVREMARRCIDLGWIPQLLIASPALRTRQTAEGLLAAFGLPAESARHEPRLYLAPPEALLEVLRALDVPVQHLMLVGHNPGISELADRLAPYRGIGDFAPAAACRLLLEADGWHAIDRARLIDVRYVRPGGPFAPAVAR